jgi:hypothetical protein
MEPIDYLNRWINGLPDEFPDDSEDKSTKEEEKEEWKTKNKEMIEYDKFLSFHKEK